MGATCAPSHVPPGCGSEVGALRVWPAARPRLYEATLRSNWAHACGCPAWVQRSCLCCTCPAPPTEEHPAWGHAGFPGFLSLPVGHKYGQLTACGTRTWESPPSATQWQEMVLTLSMRKASKVITSDSRICLLWQQPAEPPFLFSNKTKREESKRRKLKTKIQLTKWQ